MIVEYLGRHFLTIFLLVGFALIMTSHKLPIRGPRIHYLWLTATCVALLLVQDILEEVTSLDPDLIFWRTLLSVFGYTLRPIAVLGITLVVAKHIQHQWVLWIPALVNMVLMCTAFFSDVAFGYDETYLFYRGPLGYGVFAVCAFYLVLTLIFIPLEFRLSSSTQGKIIFFCGIMCVLAAVADIVIGGGHYRLNASLILSALLFYVVLRTHEKNIDPLTDLFNREALYEDQEQYLNTITAVVSMDMNGLKRVNDTQGHAAGDQALKTIGACLRRRASKTMLPYRIGGDEFLLLFLKTPAEKASEMVDLLKRDIGGEGVSVSTGIAFRDDNQPIDELYSLADKGMYEEKRRYYTLSGIDRRAR